MAFQFASTNLVIELGIILAVLMGWQFKAGEYLGGPIMIVLLALLFRRYLKSATVAEARAHANAGVLGLVEHNTTLTASCVDSGLQIDRRPRTANPD
jgi:hypothetical protein